MVLLGVVCSLNGACASIHTGDLGPDGGGAGGGGGNIPVTLPDGASVPDAPAGKDAAPVDARVPVDVVGGCRNLECRQTTCVLGGCQQTACPPGQRTTVSGTVFDPAGKVPLYNVAVYVPNEPLKPMSAGVACTRCQASVDNVLVVALTDVKGQFRLDNVPVGNDIPLVIQVGKWRRAVKIPNVAACANTAMANTDLTRLPRDQSEGDLPRIALTTGGHDALECLLRKVGIADREFTPESGVGRVNLFAGTDGTDRYAASLNGGAPLTPVVPWWDSADNLKKYDVILHSCDGTAAPTNKSATALTAFQQYVDAGGRVFASHFHNYWLAKSPSVLSTIATFSNQLPLNDFTSNIDVSFPKGAAFADWLLNVGASTTRGQLSIKGTRDTVSAVTQGKAQRWIYSSTPQSIQYLTASTPVGVAEEQQCGRVVFSDIHVSSGAAAGFPRDRSLAGPGDPDLGFPFPSGCVNQDLSPQELAMEFMLFDLSTCIQGGAPIVQ